MKNFLYNLATDKSKGFFAAIAKFLLFILSLIYGLVIRLLMAFYEKNQYQPVCKVISVGNITLGGTGKTPLVEYIAKYLNANGHSVAVVTRGYKRKLMRGTKDDGRWTKENESYEAVGDEAYMLQNNLKGIPVIVDADRIRAIKSAVSDYAVDTVILDDGFQQWKIKKDLEIVVIDSVNPFGNRKMIPRGIMRQPISSLKKADVFVLAKTNINPDIENIINFLKGINPKALIIESMHKPTGFYELFPPHLNPFPQGERKENIFTGQTIALVSGIGDPGSFEKLVESLGITVKTHFKFQDHHDYSNLDLEEIAQDCRKKNVKIIITTEKDAVKLCRLPVHNYQLSIFVLFIELKITKNEEGFSDRLFRLYSA